jgi:Zn-dependent protease with chaperone function
MAFTLHCFGPGLPAGGVSAIAAFEGEKLVLDLGGRRVEADASCIGVQAGGFDHQQLMLSWQDEEGAWSALAAGAADQAALRQQAPATLQQALSQWQGKTRAVRRRFRVAAVLLGVLLLLPVLMLGVFWWQAENIAGWVAQRVPVEVEQRLGELSFAQIKATGKLVEHSPAQRVVEEIGTRLTRDSRYHYQWFVLEDDTVNAFAMPGGYVVVHTGLIEAADSAEELAGVLAHEVQHVEQRHSLKGLVHGLGWQAALSLAIGDVSGSVWGGLANQLGQLKFSRAQESEADLAGLKALAQAGIDPSGMLRFFEQMAERDGVQVTLLSSHPASADRFAAIQSALAGMDLREVRPLPYEWAGMRATRAGE